MIAKVQHDFFGDMMPVLASRDNDAIINSTTAFVSLRWSKWDATQHFSHLTLLALASAVCGTNSIVRAPLHSLGHNYWNNVQYNLLGHVMQLMVVAVSHYDNSVINGTILFVR